MSPQDPPRKKVRLDDPCPVRGCTGRLGVYSTRITDDGASRVQYLACRVCGHRPEENKVIMPIEFSPPRAPRRLNMQRLNFGRRDDRDE